MYLALIDPFGVPVNLLRHKKPFWAPWADLLARASHQDFAPKTGVTALEVDRKRLKTAS